MAPPSRVHRASLTGPVSLGAYPQSATPSAPTDANTGTGTTTEAETRTPEVETRAPEGETWTPEAETWTPDPSPDPPSPDLPDPPSPDPPSPESSVPGSSVPFPSVVSHRVQPHLSASRPHRDASRAANVRRDAREHGVFHARKPRVSIESLGEDGDASGGCGGATLERVVRGEERGASTGGDDGDEESERGGEIEVYDGAGGREAVCSADEAAAGCDAVPVPRALHEVTGGCAEDEDVGVAGDGDARAVVRGGGVFFDRGERGRGEGRGERGGGHAGGGRGGDASWGSGGTHAEDGAASKLAPTRPRAGGSLGGVGEDQVEEMHAPALSDDGKGGAPVAPLGGEVGALLEDRLGRPRVPPDATPVAAAAPNLNRGWGDERRRPRASVVFQSHRGVVSARGALASTLGQPIANIAGRGAAATRESSL